MNSIFRAHLFLLITTLVGAFNYSIAKIVMPNYVQPSAIIIIRGLAATAFFWLIHLIFIREEIKDKKDYRRLFTCALFGITANQILFFEGLNLTTPINASLLQCGVPVFVMLVAFITAKERITALKLLGLLIGIIGASLLLIHSSNKKVEGTNMGDVLVIFNAISYAIFLILVQPLTEKYHPFTVVKWLFLFGTILNIPFGYQHFQEVDWSNMPIDALLSLIYIVVFATILNYYLNVGVLRYVNPSVAGIYIYLQPVFASIIAIVMGKDTLSIEKVGYSLLILGGVYLVSRKEKIESAKPKL